MRIKINKKEYLTAHESIKENANVRASIKKQVAEQVSMLGTHNRKGGVKIEVVETKPTEKEGGIEIFARVFRNGKQYGFGKGDVDIERFIVWNFPILVSDPQGDIVREWTDPETKEVKQRIFSEDPQEALLQVIEHNLSVMKNVHDDSKIVKGKRGNTTSTFYPDAGTGGTTVDGSIVHDATGWDTVHDSLSGNAKPSDTTGWAFSRQRSSVTTDTVHRYFALFDTSALGSDTVDSAIFSTYGNTVRNNHTNTDRNIGIVQTSPASNNNLVDGDFDQCGAVDSPTEGATRLALSSLSTSAYNDWTLNATGRSWVDGSGVTKLGLRTSWDLDDVRPTPTDSSGSGYHQYNADTSGTSQDPKLVVEHSAAATATGNFLPFFL